MTQQNDCGDTEKATVEDKNKCELWRFYEKAIEGRNTHYAQYLKYVNLYAIFMGALFVAFYTLLDSIENQVFTIPVAVLGLITSILWLCSVKGYYAWINSWINVVQYYEECLNEGKRINEARFVYGLFFETEPSCCSVTAPSRFSTQKLTLLFVFSCIIGWITIILLMIEKYLYKSHIVCNCINECCVCVILLLMVLVLLFVFVKTLCKSLHDNINFHYRLERELYTGNEKVEKRLNVHPPKK